MSPRRSKRSHGVTRTLALTTAIAVVTMLGVSMAPSIAADTADEAADPAVSSVEKTPDPNPTSPAKTDQVTNDKKEEAPAPDPSPTTKQSYPASSEEETPADEGDTSGDVSDEGSDSSEPPSQGQGKPKYTFVRTCVDHKPAVKFSNGENKRAQLSYFPDDEIDGAVLAYIPANDSITRLVTLSKVYYEINVGMKEDRGFVSVNLDCGTTPPPTCVKDSPTYVWGPTVVSAVGTKASNFVSVWDAENKADQNLIEAVKAGKDCMGSVPVPPAMCEDHQYQGDVSREEPPMNITDTNGDGIADIPGFIAGELFTVKGDPSLCTPPPVKTEVVPADVTSSDVCGTDNDTYTIPSTEGVVYKVDGKVVEAGTYPATGPVTVKAQAIKKYVLKKGATKSWPLDFTNEACPPEVVINPTATVVVKCDGSGSGDLNNKLSTIEQGFETIINGTVKAYSVKAGDSLPVVISGAKPGSTVIVQNDSGILDSATVPKACEKVTKTTKTSSGTKVTEASPLGYAASASADTTSSSAHKVLGLGLIGSALLLGLGLIARRENDPAAE